jgi:CSLREA domain-containing protein
MREMTMKLKPLNIKHWIQILSAISALFILVVGSDHHVKFASAEELAVIIVNTTDDELNEDGDCSLREAIRAANLDSQVDSCQPGDGRDTIQVGEGTFLLKLTGIGEDEALNGDLDITDDLTITGAGVSVTIIDGDHLDRVFHVVGDVSVVIAGMTIQNGNASTSSGLFGGGGILNENGNLVVRNSTISSNRAVRTGGGIDNAGTSSLVDVTISGNSSDEGGGIFNDGSLSLTNTTLNNNESFKTGGGLDNSGDSTLTNVTIDNNTTQGKNGGDGIFNDGNLTVLNGTIRGKTTVVVNENIIRFKNTIVTGAKNNENCKGSGTFTSNGYNLDSGNTCNFKIELGDIIQTPPMLGELQDNQGPTKTVALEEGSPAIDTGDDIDCPPKDQRGALRPADGDKDETETCDIGAFEYGGKFNQPIVYLPMVMH